MDAVQITYLGHACFCLESGGYRTVLDPYADGMVPGLPPLRVEADAVYCSHGHDDHNFVNAVRLPAQPRPAPYRVEEILVPHDDCGGARRGMNTIRIFHFGSLRVAHLGDLGRMLTEEEAEKLAGVSCMMIPTGGYYTIDAQTAKAVVDRVQPRVCIPMHYRTDTTGFAVLSHLRSFTDQFDRVRVADQLTVTQEIEPQVCVLRPQKKGATEK